MEEKGKEDYNPRDYGYHLFPERKGTTTTTLTGLLSGTQGQEELDRMKCEKTLYKCFTTSKLVKLMRGALKSAGCMTRSSVDGLESDNQEVDSLNVINTQPISDGGLPDTGLDKILLVCGGNLSYRTIDDETSGNVEKEAVQESKMASAHAISNGSGNSEIPSTVLLDNQSDDDIDLRRHVVCEVCNSNVSGGYDPETNQIVICQNNTKSMGVVQGILTHEMVHMFDYCKNKVDFKNIDHLACTEIRAANLTHCSFVSAMLQSDVSLFNIKAKHQECVKRKAVTSIIAVRNISVDEAFDAVDRVFGKCYADLEPIGRRLKTGSTDTNRAYAEGFLYGYV